MSAVHNPRLGLNFTVMDTYSWKDSYVEEVQIQVSEQAAPIHAPILKSTYRNGISIPLFQLEKRSVVLLKLSPEQISTLLISAVWVNKDESRSLKPVSLVVGESFNISNRCHDIFFRFCDGVLSAKINSHEAIYDAVKLAKQREELFNIIYNKIGLVSALEMNVKSFCGVFTENSIPLTKNPIDAIRDPIKELMRAEITKIDPVDLQALLFRAKQLTREMDNAEVEADWIPHHDELQYQFFTAIGGYPNFHEKLESLVRETLATCHSVEIPAFGKAVLDECFRLLKKDFIASIWE